MNKLVFTLIIGFLFACGGYIAGAQGPLADFKVTVSTTDRGAGVKMTCERGCAWKELSFSCEGQTECAAVVDAHGVGGTR